MTLANKSARSVSLTVLGLPVVLATALTIVFIPGYVEWYWSFLNTHWAWEHIGFRWIPIFQGLAINGLMVTIGIIPGGLFAWHYYNTTPPPRLKTMILLWILATPGTAMAMTAMMPFAFTFLLGAALD